MPGARRGVAYRASSAVILDFANVRSRALLAPPVTDSSRPCSQRNGSCRGPKVRRRRPIPREGLRASQENNITHTKRTRPNEKRDKETKKKKGATRAFAFLSRAGGREGTLACPAQWAPSCGGVRRHGTEVLAGETVWVCPHPRRRRPPPPPPPQLGSSCDHGPRPCSSRPPIPSTREGRGEAKDNRRCSPS